MVQNQKFKCREGRKLVKIYWLCRAEGDNRLNLLKLFDLFFCFFKSFKFRCCSFCLVKKKLQLTVQVTCLFYFLPLSRFFKGKVKTGFLMGFIGFFKWTLKKKKRVFFFWSYTLDAKNFSVHGFEHLRRISSLLTAGLPNLFSAAGHFHMRKFIAGHKRFCDITIDYCDVTNPLILISFMR